MRDDLQDRVALVTGSSRGGGKSVMVIALKSSLTTLVSSEDVR